MDAALPSTDWSLIQAFLAVADTGSLSAAARLLGQSQPTLGRQIRTLEESLGTALFDRHARGLSLSEAGADLLPMAQEMRGAMQRLNLAAAGRSQAPGGTVRITASVFISHYVLPPILAGIRAAEPGIDLVLIPTDRAENLLFREADIAVRMYRPEQLDIVARHVTDVGMGTFAAKSYLDRAGRPARPEDLFEHDLIGFETSDLIVRTMRALGWNVAHDAFAVRCDNHAACWELLRAGCGIGFGQASVGRADPTVEELDLGITIPGLEVWLAAHEAMRSTPRVRRVWDLLAAGLKASQA